MKTLEISSESTQQMLESGMISLEHEKKDSLSLCEEVKMLKKVKRLLLLQFYWSLLRHDAAV